MVHQHIPIAQKINVVDISVTAIGVNHCRPGQTSNSFFQGKQPNPNYFSILPNAAFADLGI